MMEFIHDVQVKWKNTRALREELRDTEIVDDRDVDQLFEDMQLPAPGTDNTTNYCKEALVQLLDHSFFHFLASCTEGLDSLIKEPETAPQSTILQAIASLVQSYDFKDFMAAAALWRQDRLKRAALFGHACCPA